jgi:signal transduction histidine kinase
MTIDKSTKNTAHRDAPWYENESVSVLVQSHLGIKGLALLSMLLMSWVLAGGFDTRLVIAWLVVSVVALLARLTLTLKFQTQLNQITLAKKAAFAKYFELLWTASALFWALSGFVFFTHAAAVNQYLARAILTGVAFVCVLHLSPHRHLAVRFINILQGVQAVGALWFMATTAPVTTLQYAHLFELSVLWLVFRVMIRRFNENFNNNKALKYLNAHLLQSLQLQIKQLEREKQVVSNANETINRFYSSAAHDIRQPVYALNIYADLITDDSLHTQKLAQKIKASCHAINALFHSLFDFEKIHAGHFHISPETIDLVKMFSDLQTQFQPLAEIKKLDLRVRPLLGRVQADPALIEGILSHLVSNAIKYTNQGGVILAARRVGQHISFEVWDTGIGIDNLHQTQVFDEFFKVNEQSSADEGFGLGLSVVKRLAALVEGSSVTLHSRPGCGSVFKFRLPLAMYSGASTTPLPPVQSPLDTSL